MFKDKVLEILLNEKNEGLDYFNPSDDLIKFFDKNPEELNNFENEIITRKGKKLKGLWIIYKKYEVKAKEVLGQEASIRNVKSHLNPIRYPTKDFFIADIFDNVEFRDDIASMEHPVFALKTGNKKTIKYEHNGNSIVIAPNSEYGMATIFDKDILIYCVSKLITAINEGKPINRTIQFTTYDFLATTNRAVNGAEYQRVKDSMERLRGTSITTTISTGGKTTDKGFGLIDNWEIVKEDMTGNMINLEVTLNEWLFRAISSNEVLKINHDYFRLRKPIDRRIYELARKHCGNQKKFEISLELLKKKTGSTASIKEFRRNIKSLSLRNELPDYLVKFNRMNDIVTFINRS